MVEWFSVEAQQAKKENVKKRLKISWKWIKETVAEWSSLKSYIDQVQHFHKRLRKLCGVDEQLDDLESLELILSSLRK